MKHFLDTNILIDKLAYRQPYLDEVKMLCAAKFFGDVSLLVSVQSYLDAIYVLGKYAPQSEIRRRCISSFKFFDVVDVDKSNLLPALNSGWPDVEDFMIAKTASDAHADYLITRDAKGFKDSQVKAMSPSEFFQMFKDCYNVEYSLD